MPVNDEQIVFDSVVNIVTQGADDALDLAGKLDKALAGVEGTYGVNIDLNLTNADVLSDIKGLDTNYAPMVNIDLQNTDVLTDIKGLQGLNLVPQINPELDEAALLRLNTLGSATLTPGINPFISDDAPIKRVETLDGANIAPTVDAKESAQTKSVLERIATLQQSGVIDLSLNVIGSGLDIIGKAYEILTASDEAVASLNARVAGTVPDAEAKINALYEATGLAREGIADVLVTGTQIGLEGDFLTSASQSAIEFSQVWGTDVIGTLKAANQLVERGTVPTFEAAFDTLTTAFQSPLGAQGDVIESILEYSTNLDQLGLSMQELLSIGASGAAAGIPTFDKTLDLWREFDIRSLNVDDSAAVAAFAELGLTAEAEARRAGELSGAEFFNAVISSLEAADPSRQQALGASIFGSVLEDYSFDAVTSINTADDYFDHIEGRMDEATTQFNDTFGKTVNGFFRAIEVEAQSFLSSDALGLETKLSTLREQIQGTLDALSSGESLPEAIEIGFNIPGFADEVARFGASVSGFAIGVLELIAGVQDFTGNTEAAASTRLEVARLSERQLAYNLQIANPDEIAGEITTALGRGVSVDNISEAAGKAVDELLNQDKIGEAQELLDALREIQIAQVDIRSQTTIGTPVIASEQVAVPTGATQEDITAAGYAATGRSFVGTYTEVQLKPVIDTGAAQEQIDMLQAEYVAQAETARAEINASLAKHGEETDFLPTDSLAVFDEVWDKVNNLQGELGDLFTLSGNTQGGRTIGAVADETAMAVTTASGVIAEQSDLAAVAIEDLDARATNALVENTLTASFDMAALSGELAFARINAAILPVIANIDELDMVTASNISAAIVQLDLFGAAANRNRPLVGFFFAEAKKGVLSLPETFPILTLFTSQLNQIGAAAGKIAAATGQAAPKGYATGGIADGLFLAGENGPELISTDTSLAVLNNRSSTALIGAAQSLFAGLEGIQAGNVVNNSNREFVVNQYFSTTSEAESMSAAQQAADAMRGFTS